MSAPLRPAAFTRTSSSPACGDGIGVLLDDDRAVADGHGAHGPDPCTAPTPADLPVPTRGISSKNGVTPRQWPPCRACRTLPPVPRIPPLWRESRFGLELAELRRSPVFRGHGVPGGDGRAVMLIPGFLAGDGSLGDDDALAARRRLPHAPRRDPRQRRLLRGGLRAAGGPPGGLRRGSRPEGRDRRPEPRRRVRPRARRPPARPRRGHRHARLPDGLPAEHPPARARAGRRRVGARQRQGPRPVQLALPARELLRGLPRRARRATFPAERRLRRHVLAHGRHRRLALLPGRVGPAGRGRRLALRHVRQRAGLPRARVRARRLRAPADGAAAGPRRPSSLPRAIAPSISDSGDSTTLPWPGASRAGSSARSAFALSSAVGRCQVAFAGSGKRG